ncbi:alpha/beta hydrolase [Svornostia abyssi]|uniref:Alpha/beta hydrolase n=1 Tax=Svornostia abyssi TaxID=2898438 RepID=A0ABY5PKK3_9ACTN|nr:alpha/beta hydrolase [Parviterribacteraceae bacterium J379]
METIAGAALLHTDGAFLGAAGLRITWQSWQDATAPTRAHVVVAHGAAEHGGRYLRLARELAPRGFPVWAIDHRGHGRSEGPRVVVDRFAHAVADLDTLIDHVEKTDLGRPIYLLGHSMGGALALLYALEHQARLEGMVLSAPAASDAGAPAAMRVASRVFQADRLLSRFAPSAGVLALDADGLSRDPAEVQAYRDDPLVTLGKLPARTVGELGVAIRTRFKRDLGDLTLPLLLIHGEADRLVPVAGSRHVRDRAGSDDVTLLVYPEHRHEVFNELPADREKVLADVAAWLDARAPRRTGRFTR